VDLRFSDEEEAFRARARAWLEENLAGDFAVLRGRGGPGDEEAHYDLRRAWELHLGRAGWSCLGWPRAWRPDHAEGDGLIQQVLWNEEYVRARAPGRLSHIGEELLGPTLIAFGTEAQKRRFLPAIARGDTLWCQGYSEPNAGSDLANVQTRAERDGDEWVVTGQKVWTSLAQYADWCFVLCRTDPAAPRHRGLSYLLVPMKQPGVTIRPIRQLTGTAEFNEVFFDGARTGSDCLVGELNGGWRVAMATLAFERGASTLGQQLGFAAELERVIAAARARGRTRDPLLRRRLVDAWMGLRVLRLNALRMLSGQRPGELSPGAMIMKLAWSHWHRDLGELALDVLGPDALVDAADDDPEQALRRLFLFTRADTIYAGSSEIQRNLIGERALGLPAEPRPE
jgi:alkylation response protein AidB-like acyl-CoA dehydrogenase